MILIPLCRRLFKRVRSCVGGQPGQWVYLGVSVHKARKVTQWLGVDYQRLSMAGMLQAAGVLDRSA